MRDDRHEGSPKRRIVGKAVSNRFGQLDKGLACVGNQIQSRREPGSSSTFKLEAAHVIGDLGQRIDDCLVELRCREEREAQSDVRWYAYRGLVAACLRSPPVDDQSSFV